MRSRLRTLRADLVSATPGAVRAIIDYALQHGWDPTAIGGRHELPSGAEVGISGFRLTDRLTSPPN
jgi:hypothetical protein